MTSLDEVEVRLKSLRPSISDMSEEEATSLIRESRANRRPIPKEVKDKEREDKKTDALLGDLSPEAAQALLDQLTATASSTD